MPKKGARKGAGAKRSAGTEEDRILFLHQRAEAEKDIAKRKEEMLTQFLKDKLQKEEKNTAVNLHKLTQQWRTVLRRARGAELHRDIGVVSQTFERVLDCKDSVIKCLVSDLSEAEQQFGLALRSQLHHVDRLLALQAGRLQFFQQQWNIELQELGTEFSTEREYISFLHQQACTHLENVSLAMEQRHSEAANGAQQDYQSSRDEIKTMYISEKHALEVQMEQLLQQVCEGPAASEDQCMRLNNLLMEDQSRAQEIDTHRKKVQHMQESISALRKPNSSQKASEAAAQEMRASREAVTQQTRRLKAELGGARVLARARLTTLTVRSGAAAKQLQGILPKGEKILRRAEMCRKFESEREKVLPFYTSSLTPEEQSQETATAPEQPQARAMLDHADLARFWQRYNKVLLERLCFEKEKEVLTRENRQLRDLLRQYMDGISVSDEALRRLNPLLTVSQPSRTPAGATGGRRQQQAAGEAVHVVQRAL